MAFPAGKSNFQFPEKKLIPQFFNTKNMGKQKKIKNQNASGITQAPGLQRKATAISRARFCLPKNAFLAKFQFMIFFFI